MKERWKRNEDDAVHDGQPIAKKWNTLEPIYKPKLLTHSPSLRAIRNYNELPIDNTSPVSGLDNPGFQPDYQYEYYVHPDYKVTNGSNSKVSNYDYPTMSTVSIKTTSAGSEVNSNMDATEMGSSVKLVTEKVERSCKTWCTHISTVICTISMAAGLGNLYRLPQTTLIHGGLPFLVIYAILTVIVGLPLLFLELGVGQMAQEGYIKSWRAVPFFKGIGYIKLLTGCLVSIYYPLYMGLAILYLIWILKGPIPFSECANGVVITDTGYSTTSKAGQECIRTTFIKNPFEDPFYFGVFAAALFFVWIAVTLLSVIRTKSYMRSLVILFFPMLACYIAFATKSILLDSETSILYRFFNEVDWNLLRKAEIWYYAIIQVFFSTHIGFGPFVTNAGIMYNKLNPLWTAVGYMILNLIFGIGSIIMCVIMTQNTSNITGTGSKVAEVHLFASLYDIVVEKSKLQSDFHLWMIAPYFLFILSGFISMATLNYSSLKAIYGHDAIRLKRWQTSLLFNFSGFILSCLLLLRYDFDLVHLLDHYVVGNMILVTVVIEVISFVAFYGTGRLRSDFEFILGRPLLKIWPVLWWIIPILLTAVFVWGLATLSLEGIFKTDPVWLYAIGWSLVLIGFIFIFAIGIFVVKKQDGYTTVDKLKASLEPSHNWGPKDPMLRHNWVQWNSKAQVGERDFTLKRRGTKDYTKTIKKKAKKEASELSAMSIAGAYFQTDVNTLNRNSVNDSNGIANPRVSSNSNYSRDQNRLSNGGNYDQLYYVSNEIRINIESSKGSSVQDSSLQDSLEKNEANSHKPPNSTNRNSYPVYSAQKHDKNHRKSYPAKSNKKLQEYINDENSEGYGTFRNKGPYVIEGGDEVGHVCHKKFSSELETTEL